MRTTRRGLTVIELVLILLAIGLIAYFGFRYLGRDEAPATPAADGALADSPAAVAPGDALAERLALVVPLDSTAAAGDTLLVRVRATTADGTGVANASIAFEVVSGGGTVTPDSVATNDLGEVETRWVLGATAGAQELRGAVAGSPGATVTATVRATEGGSGGTR